MTIICIDNTIMVVTLKISNSQSRYRKNVAIGYLAPAAVTVLAIIVEFTANRDITWWWHIHVLNRKFEGRIPKKVQKTNLI